MYTKRNDSVITTDQLEKRTQQIDQSGQRTQQVDQSGKRTQSIVKDVHFIKGIQGLGFCIEGGKNSANGDTPVTVRRVFTTGMNMHHYIVQLDLHLFTDK